MIEPLEEDSHTNNRTKTKKILSDISSNRILIYALYLIVLFLIIFIFYSNSKNNNNLELIKNDFK